MMTRLSALAVVAATATLAKQAAAADYDMPATPTPTPVEDPTSPGSGGVEQAEYLGCFHDNQDDRVLGETFDDPDMTTEVRGEGPKNWGVLCQSVFCMHGHCVNRTAAYRCRCNSHALSFGTCSCGGTAGRRWQLREEACDVEAYLTEKTSEASNRVPSAHSSSFFFSVRFSACWVQGVCRRRVL